MMDERTDRTAAAPHLRSHRGPPSPPLLSRSVQHPLHLLQPRPPILSVPSPEGRRPSGDPALCRSPHAPADAAPHIYLDSMAFGMGAPHTASRRTVR